MASFRLKSPPRPKLRENHVEQQICDYLQLRGWKPIRLHVGRFKPLGGGFVQMGEKGQADWLFLRPARDGEPDRHLFVETKRPGNEPEPDQVRWAEHMRVFGFTVTWADSVEAFDTWYRSKYGRG